MEKIKKYKLIGYFLIVLGGIGVAEMFTGVVSFITNTQKFPMSGEIIALGENGVWAGILHLITGFGAWMLIAGIAFVVEAYRKK